MTDAENIAIRALTAVMIAIMVAFQAEMVPADTMSRATSDTRDPLPTRNP